MSLTEKIDENTIKAYMDADTEIKHMEEMAKSQIKDINFLDGIIERIDNDVQNLEKDEIVNKENIENNEKEKVPNKILRNFSKWEKYMKEYDLELKEELIGDMKDEHENIQNCKIKNLIKKFANFSYIFRFAK